MTSSLWISERRYHRRARVAATASLLRERGATGTYPIENLCAGGALLSGVRSPLEPGERLRVVLRIPRNSAFFINAHVVRQEQTAAGEGLVALAFYDVPAWIEDALQEEVVRALEREEHDRTPTVLVVDDSAEIRTALGRQLGALGYRSLLAAAPLDVIRLLHGTSVAPVAALVDLFLGPADGLDVIAFLADEFPGVRRVLMSGQIRPAQLQLALDSGRAHAVMEKPWSRDDLKRALADAPPRNRDGVPHSTRIAARLCAD